MYISTEALGVVSIVAFEIRPTGDGVATIYVQDESRTID